MVGRSNNILRTSSLRLLPTNRTSSSLTRSSAMVAMGIPCLQAKGAQFAAAGCRTKLHGTHGRMCSQIQPEWTVSLEPLRAKLSGKAYIEPTDSMVLENYLSLEPVLSINRVRFRGSILKVLGSLGQAVDAAVCCQRQCPLGRCGSSFPIAVAPSSRTPAHPTAQVVDGGCGAVQRHPPFCTSNSGFSALLAVCGKPQRWCAHGLRPEKVRAWSKCQ